MPQTWTILQHDGPNHLGLRRLSLIFLDVLEMICHCLSQFGALSIFFSVSGVHSRAHSRSRSDRPALRARLRVPLPLFGRRCSAAAE